MSADNLYQIYGPPGTGKTGFVTRQVALEAERFGESKVVVTSFTTAAARTAARRVPNMPERNIGTLHALAFRALDRPVIAETKIGDWNRDAPERWIVAGKEGANLDEPPEVGEGSGEGDRLISSYNWLRNRLVPRAAWPQDVLDFAAAWEEWKVESALMDFTDLIEIAATEHPWAPGAPKVIFLDEAQDTTPLQFKLLERWSGGLERLYYVGDPDQTLYQWLGATPESFLADPPPEERIRVLSRSRRVPALVLAYARTWTDKIERRRKVEYLPRVDADGAEVAGKVYTATAGTWQRPESWVAHLEEITVANGTGDTAMLLASCAYMLRPALAILRANGIPFHNPYRPARGDWNPLARRKGTSTVDRLLAYLAPKGADRAGMWTRREFALWAELLHAECFQKGAKKSLQTLSEGQGADDEMPADEMLGYLREGALNALWGMNLSYYASAVIASKQKALAFPLTVARRRGAAALTTPPRIVVGTIHSVKGGEADHVLVAPDISAQGADEYAATPDNTRRQFYVACTRARETLALLPGAGPRKVEW